jgi:hypothetical protein
MKSRLWVFAIGMLTSTLTSVPVWSQQDNPPQPAAEEQGGESSVEPQPTVDQQPSGHKPQSVPRKGPVIYRTKSNTGVDYHFPADQATGQVPATEPASEDETEALPGEEPSKSQSPKAVATVSDNDDNRWAAISCPRTTPTPAVDATPGWLGDLAFDSNANRWLVVSHDNLIHGRIMGNNGKPVTDAFVIGSADQTGGWSPLAAFAPDADKYLVVWVDYSKGVNLYGRFVSSDGNLEKQFAVGFSGIGGEPLLNIGGDRTSALRYDGANKRFVFTTMTTTGQNHTVLTTIDLDGHQGPSIEIGTMQNKGNWGPSVAVNPDKNEYCVAYDQRNAPKWALSRVNAETLAVGPESTAGIVTTNVDIAYNPAAKKYLVIYDAGYAVGVKGRLLNSCSLNDAGKDFLILPQEGYSSVASNPAGNTYAAIGQDGKDYANSYSVVDAGGKALAGNPLFAMGSKIGNFLPVIRANTNDGTYAATSSRDYAMTRFVAQIGCGKGPAAPVSGVKQSKTAANK